MVPCVLKLMPGNGKLWSNRYARSFAQKVEKAHTD